MSVLFFLIFLMNVSAYSASGEATDHTFSVFLNHKEWAGASRVFHTNVEGVTHPVRVSCKCQSEEEGEVRIENEETKESVLITMEFSLKAKKSLITRIHYNDEYRATISSEAYIGVKHQHPEAPNRGIGMVKIVTLTQPIIQWQSITPGFFCSTRPERGGIINCETNAIDVTQYLFESDDSEKGNFVRMIVQYSDLSNVKLEWGKERYYGHKMHDDAETVFCGKLPLNLKGTQAPSVRFW